MAYIEIKKVDKYFGENRVLADINLTVEKGQFVTLLGSSGCGKSTLLRCIAGLESVSAGNVFLDGEDITHREPKKRSIGMVFQQYSLFPNMNVLDNIAFGLKVQKFSTDEIGRRVEHIIEKVELKGKERAFPAKLSGGQQQRVALARSMVMQPKVLLLDEPLSAIDAKLRKSLRNHIKDIHREFEITCLFVTHDQDEALIMSDIIHLFHEGKIEQSGKPIEMYTHPKTHFAASFIGNYNILSAAQFAGLTGGQPGGMDIAIRPEAIGISVAPPEPAEDCYVLAGRVRDFVPHGNVLRYSIEARGVKLHADVLFRSFQLFEPGQPIYIHLEKRNCLHLSS